MRWPNGLTRQVESEVIRWAEAVPLSAFLGQKAKPFGPFDNRSGSEYLNVSYRRPRVITKIGFWLASANFLEWACCERQVLNLPNGKLRSN